MTQLDSWLVVMALAIGTFLIRYSFIGLFAQREMPSWLEGSLKLLVPAVFSAIVATGVVIVGGNVGDWTNWPRYAAALIAFAVALRFKGNLPYTIISGMVALHGLTWLRAAL